MSKKGIVFINDKWGRFDDGGIDVFNQKLCEAMGYVMKREEAIAICLVISTTAVANKEEDRAKDHNVRIICYAPENNESFDEICGGAAKKVLDVAPDINEFVWIGHDIHTGGYACKIAEFRKKEYTKKERCAVILHTDYFRVHADRDREGAKRDNNEKTGEQNMLVAKADYVFCVGPKILKNVWCIRSNIIRIIPGLAGRKTDEINRNFKIMIAGRFFGNSEKQKNWKGTCKAVVDALNLLSDSGSNPERYIVTVYGMDPQMSNEELTKLGKEEKDKYEKGIRPTFQMKRFDPFQKDYLKELEESAILVMGSEHESFGMVAWEALALEVPIVISESSGLYEYLENELGYLLKGLCGSFPADRDCTMQCMSRSIADILRKPEKMQKASALLRDMMDNHKWESLAIEVAQKVGVNAVMDEMTQRNHDCFEFTYAERGMLFSEIKACIVNKKVEKRLVFFGGVSRELFWQDDEMEKMDRSFCNAIVELLESKGNLRVYICYETGTAIKQRKDQMDEQVEKRLQKKAEKIGKFKEVFEGEYGGKFKNCINRFHLVPLTKSPSVCMNILDEDWFFTLKYENRTTQNTTMKLRNSEEGKAEKGRLRKHMKFILGDNVDNAECKNLAEKLDSWRKEYGYE